MRKFLPILIVSAAIAGCSGGAPSADNGNPAPDAGTTGKGLVLPPHTPADAGLTEKDFPVPFYPNSKPDEGAFDLTGTHDLPGNRRAVDSCRITTDSIQQVADFYKGKMKVDVTNGDATYQTVTGKAGPNNDAGVMVTAKKEDRGTTITIAADEAK